MPTIGALTSFSANTTAVASQVNSNFSTIRTAVNTYCAFLDAAAQTFTGNITINPTSGVALTLTDGGLTVTADGITVTAGGITITAGGLTVTAGGATITAGDLTATAGDIIATAGNIILNGGQAVAKRVDGGDSGTSKTVDFDTGNVHRYKLTGNCTFTFNNGRTGASYAIELMQDATGSRTVTWPASVVWGSAGAPTLTTTASRKDIILFFYNGVKYVGTVFETGINDGDTT